MLNSSHDKLTYMKESGIWYQARITFNLSSLISSSCYQCENSNLKLNWCECVLDMAQPTRYDP